MSARFQIELVSDKKKWDHFLKKSPQGNVFCSSYFLDALQVPYCLYQVLEDDVCVAGFPLLLDSKKQPLPAPYSFTMYQGLCFADTVASKKRHSRHPQQMRVVEEVISFMEKTYGKFSFCLHHAFEDLRPFQWFRYHASQKEHVQIDLRYSGILNLEEYADFDSYFSSLRELRKRESKKADKHGLRIREGGLKDKDVFFKMYIETFARQNVEIESKIAALFESITISALENGYGELLFCVDPNDKVLSGTLFVWDEKTSYYLLSATDIQYRHLGANTLLLLENIRRAFERKLKAIDFVGINSPGRGDFKIGLNADPKPYFHVRWPQES